MLTDALREKLAKLNALAERAGTAEEAATARAQFVRLCLKYGVSADDVSRGNSDDEEDFGVEEPLLAAGKLPTWKLGLLTTLAHLHGVFLVRRRVNDGELHVVLPIGQPRDVQAVRYLFVMLERDVERMTRGRGKRQRNSFRLGMVHVLQAKLKEAYGQAKEELRTDADGERQLVRLEGAVARAQAARSWYEARLNAKLGSSSARRSTVDPRAYAAGQRAGHMVNVGRASKGLASGRRLLTS